MELKEELEYKKSKPNPFYYGKNDKGEFQMIFCDEKDNKILGDFGMGQNLPCGGTWFLGKGFAFEVSYAANTYYQLSSVSEFGPFCDRWKELERHLLLFQFTIHTTKTLQEMREDLGLRW